MVKKFINVCFLIISVYVFRQNVIIFTHSDGINMNFIISKKQMFNILLTVFNTTYYAKNKRGKEKLVYAKLTNLTDTITEAEGRIIFYLHLRDR